MLQLLQSAVIDQPSAGQNDRIVADLIDIVQVMAGQKNACPRLPVHLSQKGSDRVFHIDIQADRRLVQKQQLRTV